MESELRAIAVLQKIEAIAPFVGQLVRNLQGVNEASKGGNDLTVFIVRDLEFEFKTSKIDEFFYDTVVEYQKSDDFDAEHLISDYPTTRVISLMFECAPNLPIRYIFLPDDNCSTIIQLPAIVYQLVFDFLKENPNFFLLFCGYTLDIDLKAWKRPDWIDGVKTIPLDEHDFNLALLHLTALRGGDIGKNIGRFLD